jgi:hypothetical protein
MRFRAALKPPPLVERGRPRVELVEAGENRVVLGQGTGRLWDDRYLRDNSGRRGTSRR